MENLRTENFDKEKIGEISNVLLISLYQNNPNIDSRIDFFKYGIDGEKFPQEIQAKFGQRLISFQKDIDTVAIVSGVDIENNIHIIPIDDDNEDIYEASINPYELLDEGGFDLNCFV